MIKEINKTFVECSFNDLSKDQKKIVFVKMEKNLSEDSFYIQDSLDTEIEVIKDSLFENFGLSCEKIFYDLYEGYIQFFNMTIVDRKKLFSYNDIMKFTFSSTNILSSHLKNDNLDIVIYDNMKVGSNQVVYNYAIDYIESTEKEFEDLSKKEIQEIELLKKELSKFLSQLSADYFHDLRNAYHYILSEAGIINYIDDHDLTFEFEKSKPNNIEIQY